MARKGRKLNAETNLLHSKFNVDSDIQCQSSFAGTRDDRTAGGDAVLPIAIDEAPQASDDIAASGTSSVKELADTADRATWHEFKPHWPSFQSACVGWFLCQLQRWGELLPPPRVTSVPLHSWRYINGEDNETYHRNPDRRRHALIACCCRAVRKYFSCSC